MSLGLLNWMMKLTWFGLLHYMTASILYPSITIRLRRLPGTFWHLVRSIVRALRNFFIAAKFFSSPRKFFRPRENLGKQSLDRRDQFCPKIVEIGAILAIFEPFENWKFTSHFWANSADRPEIHCIIPPTVAQLSGRSAEFAKKWLMKFWIFGTFFVCLNDYTILMM